VDGEIVVEREPLRHVAHLLAHRFRAQRAALAGERDLADARLEQPAQHLDGGGLARPVGAEEPVDLAGPHLQVHVVHRVERAEALAQPARADGDRAGGRRLVPGARKRGHVLLALERLEDRHERVLQRGRPGPHRVEPPARRGHRLADRPLPRGHVAHHDVEAIAEALHVRDALEPGEHGLHRGQVGAPYLQARQPEALAHLRGRTGLEDAPLVHEGHPVAPLGLVEIRRGHQHRHPLAGEPDQRVPELAPRDGVDAGGGLVEQQHLRLRHQRAGQRELLLHAAAQA